MENVRQRVRCQLLQGRLSIILGIFLMMVMKREKNSTHGDGVGKKERGEVCFCARTMEEARDTRRVELQEVPTGERGVALGLGKWL